MSTIGRRLQDARTTATILTALAIAGQSLLLVKSAYQTIMYAEGYSIISIANPFTDWYVVFTFVFLTPLYCMIVPSLPFLFPFGLKRRLSPLKIHLATFTLYAVLTVFTIIQSAFARVIVSPYTYSPPIEYHFTGPVTFYVHPLSLLFSALFPFFLELVVLGFAQTYIVFRVVGLIPPDKPLDQKTYSIQIGEPVVRAVINSALIDGSRIILNTKSYSIDRLGAKHVILSIRGEPPVTLWDGPTFVSTVPYQQVGDTIASTPETCELRNSIINDLERRAQDYVNERKGTRFRRLHFTDVTGHAPNDIASDEAMRLALRGTQSKLSVLIDTWGDVPRLHKVVMILCVLAFVGNLGFYFLGITKDVSAVVGTAVSVFVVFLLDLVIPLRQELLRRQERLRGLS